MDEEARTPNGRSSSAARRRKLARQIEAAEAAVAEAVGDTSWPKYQATYADFKAWIAQEGRPALAAVADMEQVDLLDFLASPTRKGLPPSRSVQGTRLTHLTTLFWHARKLGMLTHSPTLDIKLGPRRPVATTAVTLAERDDLLAAADRFGPPSRESVATKLALCGAAVSELAETRDDDFDDLEQPTRLWVGDSRRRDGRWIRLDAPAADAVRARAAEHHEAGRGTGALFLTDGADHEKRACSISVAIRLVIRAAGLGNRTGLRPGSLPGWTAARVYERTRDLDEACMVLGTRDRNAAAQLLGLPAIRGRVAA
jgi:hypothetical protein